MASDDAMRSRVLTHMTNDHSESLALFLNHYNKVSTPYNPPPPPGTLRLTDITHDHLIISHPTGRSLIPIDPPMKSLSEARTRLVQMHNDCLAALDLSTVKVSTFVLPNKLWQYVTHLLTALTFTTFTLYPSEAFLPSSGQLPSRIWSFGGYVPFVATLAYHIKDPVLVLMFIIHIGEAAWFARTRLRKHWVRRFSPVWWAWTGVVFNGGFAGITRFDEMTRQMEFEKMTKEANGNH